MKELILRKSFWEILLRFVLALVMSVYGLIKILGYQFVLPASVYDYPLKELDGVTLTWAFLGFSPWVAFYWECSN